MFKSVKHTRVSDEIVHQVKTIISEGKLKPGDRLPPKESSSKNSASAVHPLERP